MKKLLLSLIVILLFEGCTKVIYKSKCPKLSPYDKNITIHTNNKGGLDAPEAKKLIIYTKEMKNYYYTRDNKFNERFAR